MIPFSNKTQTGFGFLSPSSVSQIPIQMSSDQRSPQGNHGEDDIETPAIETTSLLSPKCEEQTLKQKITALAQHRCLYWSLFSLGWTMGSVGPLLYRIQQSYGVSGDSAISLPCNPINFPFFQVELSDISLIFVSTYVVCKLKRLFIQTFE